MSVNRRLCVVFVTCVVVAAREDEPKSSFFGVFFFILFFCRKSKPINVNCMSSSKLGAADCGVWLPLVAATTHQTTV